ncbi:MAG: FAD-dependent oxidoreductase [Bacteroidetes bacterium]|nr:FAD-dependent oxidoreductase [Bacteroidota bacterium]
MNRLFISISLVVILGLSSCISDDAIESDIVVYGGTPGGITAAVAAARNGAEVILIEQTRHVGGLNTSGLNTAESEHMINNAITGIAREFYVRMGEKFPDGYFKTFSNGVRLAFEKGDPAFFFESHVAEEVFNEMLEEAHVTILLEKYVDQVIKKGSRIGKISLDDGSVIKAKVFIDASYEGDLMSRAGVSYTYGRESRNTYNESYAGIRFMDDTLYANTVDDAGNLLPYFSKNEGLIPGEGDKRVMNYNFRPTMTQVDSNKVPVQKPAGYEPGQYRLLGDFLANYPDTRLGELMGIYPRGNGKFEFNNKQHAVISLGLFGGNLEYPDAGYEQRLEIYNKHKDYTMGFLYYLGHDPAVPEPLREEMLAWGFCRDEFTDNDHFPYYLYIREARRMVGDFVFTQHDVLDRRSKDDAVTLGSHWIDSHHIQRVALSDTSFTNEGRIWHTVTEPFEIPYRILLPKQDECKNLLVPVCSSLSHVSWCTYRLESTWMQMGHVAGTAAALSMGEESLSGLDVGILQEQLSEEGMCYKMEDLGPYHDYRPKPVSE